MSIEGAAEGADEYSSKACQIKAKATTMRPKSANNCAIAPAANNTNTHITTTKATSVAKRANAEIQILLTIFHFFFGGPLVNDVCFASVQLIR